MCLLKLSFPSNLSLVFSKIMLWISVSSEKSQPSGLKILKNFLKWDGHVEKRVIPTLLFQHDRMNNFSNFRDVGKPATSVRIYSAQDADELIFGYHASSRLIH